MAVWYGESFDLANDLLSWGCVMYLLAEFLVCGFGGWFSGFRLSVFGFLVSALGMWVVSCVGVLGFGFCCLVFWGWCFDGLFVFYGSCLCLGFVV